jgi:hypothetical protein
MSELHVVVGAGPVGRATAHELVAAGHEVMLVSRSGAGPDLPGVRREAADAADADRLVELAAGAVAIYNCVNPSDYTVWPTFWPPVAEAFLVAAERTGAVLVTASCLYGYGPVDVPMVEGMPDAATTKKARIRAGMWAEARARHEAGRIRAVEVRGSDYMGPGVTVEAGHIARVAPAALSLRAIARDVGMVSSAVYRYFPSRDELLTALIIAAYDELGDAVEQADAGVRRRSDLDKRFLAVCAAIRDWARANPHEYALLYGSPVPGYVAPQTTTTSAGRITGAFLRLAQESEAADDVLGAPTTRSTGSPTRSGSATPPPCATTSAGCAG